VSRDVINSIRDEDLSLLPVSPQAADGKAYTARDIQAAVPVAVPGGYRFAAGDPASDDPKWVRGADGRPFVLDFDSITPKLQPRVPGAFVPISENLMRYCCSTFLVVAPKSPWDKELKP